MSVVKGENTDVTEPRYRNIKETDQALHAAVQTFPAATEPPALVEDRESVEVLENILIQLKTMNNYFALMTGVNSPLERNSED